MTIFNKIKWILGIVLIFVLILTTNLIDRQNFAIVNDSIETIYSDRLVAKDIIYELSSALQQKQLAHLAVEEINPLPVSKLYDVRIQENIERFAATKLTPGEEITFNQLRKEIASLKEREEELRDGASPTNDIQKIIFRAKKHLDELSDIQMTEGRRELHESKRAINSANLFTQLEIGALIVMAVAVQIIILYMPKSQA